MNQLNSIRLIQIIVILIVSASITPAFAGFSSEFPAETQRYWIGPEYWSNPMEDWQIKDGRMECLSPHSNRNVHLLTRDLNDSSGPFEIRVQAGLIEDGPKQGSVGFRVGIQDEMNDFRSRLFYGKGIDAGITTDGKLYVHNRTLQLSKALSLKNIELILKGTPSGKQYQLSLSVLDLDSNTAIGTLNEYFDPEKIAGNIAIVNNHWLDGQKYANAFKNKNVKGPRFWFKDWQVWGEKIAAHEDRTFGPILWPMYSLSRQVMKMTVLLPPIGDNDNRDVDLQIKPFSEWVTVGNETIDPDARTATFRIEDWDDSRDIPYRLIYALKQAGGTTRDYTWDGTIRKDPKDSKDLVLAALCCQTDYGFPHTNLVKNITYQNPDLLFFAGDQIYEGVGGYGIIRTPADRSILNYLRKYYMFGWAFRDLMRDRPTLCIPDDHDVFQGNVWGNGGNAVSAADHDGGGYIQPAAMVNAVHRTHASHHPDAYDPTPIKQDISVYYGDLVYGNVSFAVLADRMFKNGPKFTVTSWTGRPDHVKDPNFDTTVLDKPGLVLLGDRQLKFLDDWGQDWQGALMKCVLSQTIFCNVATHHGGGLEMYLKADLDSNGWPQSGRDRALEAIRKACAVHVAGDQHLPSLLQHGIDDFGDAGWSFCVPAISVGYQRSWWPDKLGVPVLNRPAHGLANTGDYLDGLGNMISVYAIGNPEEDLCKENRICNLNDKSSGYGIIRFHKDSREIRFESWKLMADAKNPIPEDQFSGWPKTVSMFGNLGREAKAWLPALKIEGISDPAVQIIDEENGEIVYTVRIQGNEFTPKVFKEGRYIIKVGKNIDRNAVVFQAIHSLKNKGEETLAVTIEP